MSQKSIKEADSSKFHIIQRGKSSILAVEIGKQNVNNSLIKNDNSFSKSIDLKEKRKNSLIKINNNLCQNIDLKEKQNNIYSSSAENKKNKSKKKKYSLFLCFL